MIYEDEFDAMMETNILIETRYCPECNNDVDYKDVDDGWICKGCNKFIPK